MFEDISKLTVWQKSHTLAIETYKITKSFPKEEMYGLSSQLRRAAISIPSNIAEGRARGTDKEYRRFLLIARGSLEEAKYQLLLAKELNYLSVEVFDEMDQLTSSIGRMLNGLINKLC